MHTRRKWYGYALGSQETDTNAQSTSRQFHGGVAIKYQDGPWLIGGAVSGGEDSQETDRPSAVGAFSALFFDIEAGVEILRSNKTSLSLGYEGMISDTISEHGAYAKGTIRF